MLKIEKLFYKVGNFALREINLTVKRDNYFVLLGPTGSGKTTFAKCICGLNRVISGKIFLDGRDITELEPEERKIGYLPQDFALFPHMNVRDNILFGVKVKKMELKRVKNSFEHIIDILRIGNLLDRFINGLSGGEKQRVALARALLSEPEVLILDEPFSSIDIGLRKELWFEMKNVLNRFKIPVIHITHNLDEASVLGEKFAVLIDGGIIQEGEKDEFFSRPETEKVARYLGIKNIYSGIIEKLIGDKVVIKGERFKIIASNSGNFKEGEGVKFSIRPQDIKIIKEDLPIREELKDNIFEGEIISTHFLSDTCILKVKSVVDFELNFPSYIYQRHNLYIGKKIKIGIWQKGISIFRKET